MFLTIYTPSTRRVTGSDRAWWIYAPSTRRVTGSFLRNKGGTGLEGTRRRRAVGRRRRRAREEVQARLVDRHHVGGWGGDGLEVEGRVLRPRRDALERWRRRPGNVDRRRRLDDLDRRGSRPRQARRGPRDEWDLRFCDSSATRRPDERNRVDGADASDAANMRRAAAPTATAPFFFSAAALHS